MAKCLCITVKTDVCQGNNVQGIWVEMFILKIVKHGFTVLVFILKKIGFRKILGRSLGDFSLNVCKIWERFQLH